MGLDMEAIQTIPKVRSTQWLQVRVDGTPVHWKRPIPKGRGIRMVTLPEVLAAQKQLALRAHAMLRRTGVDPWDTPCWVSIVAAYPRPKCRADVPGIIWKEQDPDTDNIAKLVLDALQRDRFGNRYKRKPSTGWPGIIQDDNLVVHLAVSKVELEFGRRGFLEVIIRDAPALPVNGLHPSWARKMVE